PVFGRDHRLRRRAAGAYRRAQRGGVPRDARLRQRTPCRAQAGGRDLMFERFRAAYADPQAEVARALAEDRRPILTLGFDAPRAQLIAAGFQPIRAEVANLTATPRADAIMGEAAMGRRGRQLLESFLEPAHPEVPLLITQADAEQPQLF